MKTTLVEFESLSLDHEIPNVLLQSNRKRLNAFYTELQDIKRKGEKYIFLYRFYSLEKSTRLTKSQLRKQYESLPSVMKAVVPEVLPTMENKEVILYGDINSPEIKEQVESYLRQHNLHREVSSFYDVYDGKQTSYAELQKALFYCKKKECPLLFVSIAGMIQDIQFYNILETSNVEFSCVDFPWFSRENLRLMKAMALYKQL